MARRRDRRRSRRQQATEKTRLTPTAVGVVVVSAIAVLAVVVLLPVDRPPPGGEPAGAQEPDTESTDATALESWSARALAVTRTFHRVYTPCWEGAYGALGDAHLFLVTGDSSLSRFHLETHPLTEMCEGTWVDDRAWVCLAELRWWEVTGKGNMALVLDAMQRYREARAQGRLSSHEGFWSWYNWPPGAPLREPIFTNSNMNQMATVACELFAATGEQEFLDDALLVWNGDGTLPGIEQRYYRGEGRWEGRGGAAAFGKELPWNGTGYCALGAALFRATGETRYREIATATARRILDPSTGWVDAQHFYQIRMDGNGAFVHYLLDAYAVAPDELREVLSKVERMLEHVWTNNFGGATVTLHRLSDHGIRNGWNPRGGEEGYGVGEVGTVHAQGEAARAFGLFAYHHQRQRAPVGSK